MSGHSKWATTKHKKAKTDAQRSKVFTKIGREMMVAVKMGGPNPETNPRLGMVIMKARQANMPNDNVNRYIKSASGLDDSKVYEEVTYECYGPNGTAFILECLTDNKNRTASDVRHIFDKSGGSMGTNGCVSFMFDRRGVIVVEAGDKKEDDFMMDALECNAEDYKVTEDAYIAFVEPNMVGEVAKAFEQLGYKVISSQIEFVPQNYLELPEGKEESFENLLEKLDDNDDIQEYYHNVEGF